MRKIAALALLLAATACASYSGRGLVPGRATAADVVATMGKPAAKVPGREGETYYFYPQPAGRQIFRARIGADGRLLGIEQTLTEENVEKLAPGKDTESDVLRRLGPPWQITPFPRQNRVAWTYRAYLFSSTRPEELVAEFSPDRILRKVVHIDVLDGPSEPNVR